MALSGCETSAKPRPERFRWDGAFRMVVPMSTSGSAAARQRVLVVDDEPTVREVVATYLARDGYEVEVLGDGGARARHDRRVRSRPGGARRDAAGRDRASTWCASCAPRPTLPVILLTARSDETDRVLGLELGADDYLVKPFSARELAARVRSVLRRSACVRRARRRGGHRPIEEPLAFGDGLTIDTRSTRGELSTAAAGRAHGEGVRPARLPGRSTRATCVLPRGSPACGVGLRP